MGKKKVFVVSHSHWDREWYMPFEKHRLRLVELLDEVLDLIDTDPKFNSFQLDGQAIIIDDYLAMRPENQPRIEKAVAAGKLRVGPFYVLQDDFLISPESHVKDFQIGRATAEKYGNMMGIGYFPDTFGNMGQTPQMLKLAGLDAVAFGRGVKPTGLNNQVSDGNFESAYSEMNWVGPDQSQVLGILFANWYSNGNEVPVEKAEAKAYWLEKLADVERYASTDNLLMMNGVDHQPVQKDITQALAVAQELFPDYEFIHSNLDDYLAAVKADLPEDLSTINGELTSQETDGWYTLTNTASSRIYLKQENAKVQRQLINEATQLAAVMSTDGQYPQAQLTYAWKLLLENQIHDSITGCSVDPVHREMMTRFEKVSQIAEAIRDKAQASLVAEINTAVFPAETTPFVVINPSGSSKSGVIKAEVELDRALFKDGRPDAQFAKMQLIAQQKRHYVVIDADGQEVTGEITGFTTRFDADLPTDRFRVPYIGVYAQVEVFVKDLAAFSWQTFALKQVDRALTYFDQPQSSLISANHTLENQYLKVAVSAVDGSLNILDKKTQKTYQRMAVIEDTGDMGNEYIYKETADQQRIYSTDQAPRIQIKRDTEKVATIEIISTLSIPKQATPQLAYEQRAVIDITHRQATRSSELIDLELHTLVTLEADNPVLKFDVTYDNQALDHRLRVLFPTGLATTENESESIFEVVKRPNQPEKDWQNPTNPQRQQAFVNLHDDQGGVTVANDGLNEYEILPKNNTIAITLLRCVGELGDWGYFLTPEAQCQGAQHASFALIFHNEQATDRLTSYQLARAFAIPCLTQGTTRHTGNRPTADTWLTIQDSAQAFAVTGVERDQNQDLVVRGYNLDRTAHPIQVSVNDATGDLIDFQSQPIAQDCQTPLQNAEIRSYRFKANQ
ncbi:alpha-mannosidase [Latilactobacillus fuchuensis]|uniref:alpha-mannosidase n=1 Tax=Latilactobacillus fuchuensis TaxID=164393 RepID=UPI0020C77EF7|nr:alpha-mannosidase [Latilactobacillus fuchuensis]MCP8857649.1 alpha-mannosidase [Latilactobacillus fuchuensis]